VSSTRDGPLTHDAEAIGQLRATLAEAGYTDEAVRRALDTEVSTSRDSLELPLYTRVLPPGEPLSTLVKLFLLGLPATADEAAAALGPVPLERLASLGVLTLTDGVAQAELELVPVDDLLIASDRFLEELTQPDHVLGISPPTRALAALTVRPEVDTTLDLCTGNGIQALLAARHSRHVVAADVSARALRFAKFNALLNEIDSIELRQGNLFDPVEGSTFDLVVCNPPYVISPDSEFVYRDSGMRGDVFCEGIVRRLPEFLRPDGFAHVLVSWVHTDGEDWSDPLRAWVEGSGCDALLLRYATHDPLQYAAGWNRPLRADAAAYASALDRWSDHFERLGVEAISWGAVILRRRAGANWVWAYSPSSQRVTSAGNHVLRLFLARDLLDEWSDEALLEQRFELVDDHRLEQTSQVEDGSRAVESTVLTQTRGLRFALAIDEATAELLQLLDGERGLREILGQFEERLPPGVSAEEFRSRVVAATRRLVELGFLLPRPGSGLR
jgi:SAM-dependent methyltransferase